MFMNRFFNDQLPPSFNGLFRYNHEVQTAHATRQSNLLHTERCNSQSATKSPLYIFPVIWNKWNRELTQMPITKHRLKNVMLDKYSALIHCINPFCRDCHP